MRIDADENPEAACKRMFFENMGVTMEVESQAADVKHAYTHFKIVVAVFRCRPVDNDISNIQLWGEYDAFRWIRLPEIDALPLTKAAHKILAVL